MQNATVTLFLDISADKQYKLIVKMEAFKAHQ
jgi:hypothetical protein